LPSGTRLERRPHQQRPENHSGQLSRNKSAETAAAHAHHDRRSVRDKPSAGQTRLRKSLREFVDALNLKLDDEVRVGLSRGPAPRLYLSLLPDIPDTRAETSHEWLVIPLDQLAPPLPVPAAVIWLSA